MLLVATATMKHINPIQLSAWLLFKPFLDLLEGTVSISVHRLGTCRLWFIYVRITLMLTLTQALRLQSRSQPWRKFLKGSVEGLAAFFAWAFLKAAISSCKVQSKWQWFFWWLQTPVMVQSLSYCSGHMCAPWEHRTNPPPACLPSCRDAPCMQGLCLATCIQTCWSGLCKASSAAEHITSLYNQYDWTQSKSLRKQEFESYNDGLGLEQGHPKRVGERSHTRGPPTFAFRDKSFHACGSSKRWISKDSPRYFWKTDWSK